MHQSSINPTVMKSSHRRHVKFLFILILILLLLTVIILYFIFKPKRPAVVPSPVSLLHFEFNAVPKIALSITIGVAVFITNPNYAPFRYDSTLVRVFYHGELVGEALVEEGFIKARSAKHIGTAVELLVNKLIANPKFLPDVETGVLYLTAASKTEGQAIVLGFLKLHATITVECSVSIYIASVDISSRCVTYIKI